MTINQAIAKVDALKPNLAYSVGDKVLWLSELDITIKQNIIDTHEGSTHEGFVGYTESTPLDTELIAPAPYDEMYVHWLESKIDYANGEMDRYNNSASFFNAKYEAFQNYYNRTHMPKGVSKFKFFK